jgi:hypothetical protein
MNNLSKGIVIALATVAMLSGLTTVAISIPSAEAAPPTSPPSPPAGTHACVPGSQSEGHAPFCGIA